MLVLTPENTAFQVDQVVDVIPKEMYCVLDLSNIDDSDYYFHKILHVVSFSSMGAELKIGDNRVVVPLNWQILLGEEDSGMMEVSTIENLLNIKDPKAFVYNPVKSMYPRFEPVQVVNLFTLTTRWQMPILQKKNLLVVPLRSGSNPPCAMFADENDKIGDFMLGDF